MRKKFTYNFPLDRVKLINDLHTDFFLFSVAEGFSPNCFASLILFFLSSITVIAIANRWKTQCKKVESDVTKLNTKKAN